MCRLIAYMGKDRLLLDDIMEKPEHSLIRQSKAAKEGLHGINADGFGLAWYDHRLDPYPGIFRSTQPAWNDSNLKHLCKKILSNCFLGHVRASTVGDVSLNNCHPFAYENYSYVHNGTIRKFDKLKLEMIQEIGSSFLPHIKGQTDSEYFFFLIMSYVRQEGCLEKAMLRAFRWVYQQQQKDDADHFSRLNIVITDGQKLFATRFVNKGQSSLSMSYHYNQGSSNLKELPQNSIVVASEPLYDSASTWVAIPENHYISICAEDLKPQLRFLDT